MNTNRPGVRGTKRGWSRRIPGSCMRCRSGTAPISGRRSSATQRQPTRPSSAEGSICGALPVRRFELRQVVTVVVDPQRGVELVAVRGGAAQRQPARQRRHHVAVARDRQRGQAKPGRRRRQLTRLSAHQVQRPVGRAEQACRLEGIGEHDDGRLVEHACRPASSSCQSSPCRRNAATWTARVDDHAAARALQEGWPPAPTAAPIRRRGRTRPALADVRRSSPLASVADRACT